ncbi:MAG: hypothetical protein PHE77_02955 [Candidatus Pacebacteria bacterium]|nr:hypothetical protein [Candidatus Paceibacterota bacterium]
MKNKFKIFIIVIVLVVSATGLWFYLQAKDRPNEPVFVFGGVIAEIKGNILQVKEPAESNLFGKEKTFKVLTVGSTKFSLIEMLIITEENMHEPTFAKEISFTDLQIGDQITIKSLNDLRFLWPWQKVQAEWIQVSRVQ